MKNLFDKCVFYLNTLVLPLLCKCGVHVCWLVDGESENVTCSCGKHKLV